VVDAFTSATERHIEVGDGLEIYVVLAREGDAIESVESVQGVQEVTATEEGQRVFYIRRELKKD
jgi:20S proteasome subunit beta 6